jgi:hypothetical protein
VLRTYSSCCAPLFVVLRTLLTGFAPIRSATHPPSSCFAPIRCASHLLCVLRTLIFFVVLRTSVTPLSQRRALLKGWPAGFYIQFSEFFVFLIFTYFNLILIFWTLFFYKQSARLCVIPVLP